MVRLGRDFVVVTKWVYPSRAVWVRGCVMSIGPFSRVGVDVGSLVGRIIVG
jgi:hypothetical protein